MKVTKDIKNTVIKVSLSSFIFNNKYRNCYLKHTQASI